MLHELKMQKENNELKVKLKDKDSIAQTTRSNLMRLYNKNLKLGFQVNTMQQILDHEVEVNQALWAEKESVDQILVESKSQNQKLEEEVARLKEKVKKSKGGKRYFKENIIDVVMKSFFNSEA